MSEDYSFLPNLIDEDIYVIKEAGNVQKPEKGTETVEPLVVDEEKVEDVAKVEEPREVYIQPLPTAGNNLKHCIVLVESDDEILETDLKSFLENILKAVKRSLDDVLLVNVQEASIEQVEALMLEENHRHVICFGTKKLKQAETIEPYQPHTENHKFFLNADGLEIITKNVDKKKALWKALQEMFL